MVARERCMISFTANLEEETCLVNQGFTDILY